MNKHSLYQWLVGALLASTVRTALADTWSFESSQREFKFDDEFRVVVTTDAHKDTQVPDFEVRIYSGAKLLALYPGIAFDHVIASPNRKLFVGLSNAGIPGTAAAVFTLDGRLLLLATHGLASFKYCEQSVTLLRRWYDEENPDVRFDAAPEEGGITLRSCSGQRVSLLEVVAIATINPWLRTPASKRD